MDDKGRELGRDDGDGGAAESEAQLLQEGDDGEVVRGEREEEEDEGKKATNAKTECFIRSIIFRANKFALTYTKLLNKVHRFGNGRR